MRVKSFFLLILLLIPVNIYSQPCNEETHLVAYWSFDDSTAKDHSGNGFHGTMVNNPTPTEGVIGKAAMHFIGKNDFVLNDGNISNIGSHILLPDIPFDQYDGFTISMWVRFVSFTAPEGETFISYGHHNYGWLGIFDITQFGIQGIQFAVGADLSGAYPILAQYPENRYDWVQYLMTWENNVLSAYINGELQGQINQNIKVAGPKGALARHWWNYQ
ncbi:MAG: LamG-like jellyroll fold domain-containing protein, partial [Candidatus Kapaibacterium sp.]